MTSLHKNAPLAAAALAFAVSACSALEQAPAAASRRSIGASTSGGGTDGEAVPKVPEGDAGQRPSGLATAPRFALTGFGAPPGAAVRFRALVPGSADAQPAVVDLAVSAVATADGRFEAKDLPAGFLLLASAGDTEAALQAVPATGAPGASFALIPATVRAAKLVRRLVEIAPKNAAARELIDAGLVDVHELGGVSALQWEIAGELHSANLASDGNVGAYAAHALARARKVDKSLDKVRSRLAVAGLETAVALAELRAAGVAPADFSSDLLLQVYARRYRDVLGVAPEAVFAVKGSTPDAVALTAGGVVAASLSQLALALPADRLSPRTYAAVKAIARIAIGEAEAAARLKTLVEALREAASPAVPLAIAAVSLDLAKVLEAYRDYASLMPAMGHAFPADSSPLDNAAAAADVCVAVSMSWDAQSKTCKATTGVETPTGTYAPPQQHTCAYLEQEGPEKPTDDGTLADTHFLSLADYFPHGFGSPSVALCVTESDCNFPQLDAFFQGIFGVPLTLGTPYAYRQGLGDPFKYKFCVLPE